MTPCSRPARPAHADIEIEHERLLRQHMLAGFERPPISGARSVGMQRDVDDGDVRVADQRVRRCRWPARRERTDRACPRHGRGADRRSPRRSARISVGVEMREADAAGADQSDRSRPVAWHRRRVGEHGRGDRLGIARHQRIGIRRRQFVRVLSRLGMPPGPACASACADMTAVSTICCADAAESGVERAFDRLAGLRCSASTYSTGLRYGAASASTATASALWMRARLHADMLLVVVARDRAVGAHHHEAAFRLRLQRPRVGERAPARLELRQARSHSGRP